MSILKLNDILKLDVKPESLNIIQAFLNQPLSYIDYIMASTYYLKIANKCELHQLVVDEGELLLDKFSNQSPTEHHEQIYRYLINSSINLGKFSTASKHINNRRAVLSIMDQYLSLLDELDYKKALNEDYYDVLNKLLIETIPHKIKVYTYEELFNYYSNKLLLDDALRIIDLLLEHTSSNRYLVKKLEILFQQKKYDQSIILAEQILLEDSYNASAAIILIASYTKNEKFQKASALEAEYENIIELASDEVKALAYTEIIKLYELMNNTISLKHYKQRQAALKRAIKKEQTKVVIETKPEVIMVEVLKPTANKVSNAKYLEHYSWLNEWLIYSHKMDENLILREYLRKFLIEVNKKALFTEAILYDENSNESNFFNFKKERLYDKKIIKPYIEETIIEETLNQGQAVFGNVKTIKWQKDVLTQKSYDETVKYLYSYYIAEGIVMLFYFDQEIKDPSLYFDLYEGLTTIIYTKLLDNNINDRMRDETIFLNQIINKSLIPIRILTEVKSTYNEAATSLFNIGNHEHLELFLRDVPSIDAKMYNDTVKRLFNYPNECKIITYLYQDKTITEYLYAIKKGNFVNIISLFIDITTSQTKEVELLKEATIDAESNLYNKYKLGLDLDSLLKDKQTFLLIELDQSLRHIYGNEAINNFFIEFSQATKAHFSNDLVYRYDFNQLLIIINNNDIRTINKIIKDFYMVAFHLQSKVLEYEKYKFHTGILRYPVVTVEKDHNKIFRYLDVALQKAKTSRDNDYVYFIHSDYEEEVFEQQVIDYLNIALENKQLTLVFKQIIDIEVNKIWQYESELIMPTLNISNKYLNIIAKKRKRIIDLEYYHIEAVCKFLQQLEVATNRLIKLTIPISEETFLSPDFQGFLIGTLKTYKIPAEFIRIICDVDIKDQSNALKVEEMINFGISLDTTYLDTALTHNFHAVHLNFKDRNAKWRNYYKAINKFLNDNNIALILRNVNSKEDRKIVKSLGINYIEGGLYQTLNSDKLISKIKDAI